MKAIRSSDSWGNLSECSQRIVSALLRDADLAGVGLPDDAQAQFIKHETELAELGTKFNNNVVDSTAAFSLGLWEDSDVSGLPPSLLQLMAQNSQKPAVQPEPSQSTEEKPRCVVFS